MSPAMTNKARADGMRGSREDQISLVLSQLILQLDNQGFIEWDEKKKIGLRMGLPSDTIKSFILNIAEAATPVPLGASNDEDIRAIALYAHEDNTDPVFLGDEITQEWPLAKFGDGPPWPFAGNDLSKFYIRAAADGQNVRVIYAFREGATL